MWLFVFTQVHGIPYLLQEGTTWSPVRHLPWVAYIGLVVYMYSWLKDSRGRTWVRMNEIIRIPSIEYLFVVAMAAMGYGMLLATGGSVNDSDSDSTGGSKDSDKSEKPKPLIGVGSVLATLTASYLIMVVVSVAFEIVHVNLDLIVCMSVLVLLFSILALLTMAVMDKHLRRLDDPRDQKKGGVTVDIATGLHGDL